MSATAVRRYDRILHAKDVYSDDEIAAFKRSGLWRDRLLIDFLDTHRAERPDETALVAGQRRLTWRELAESADRVAAGFVTLGLRPGDFVAIQLPNCAEFVETYLGAQRAGLRVLTLQTIYRDHDVEYMLAKCAVKAYVVLDSHRSFDFVAMAGRLRAKVATIEHVIVVGQADPGMLTFAELTANPVHTAGAFAHLRPDADGLSKVSFTSGTTGKPKGVAHTHNTDLVPPLLAARAIGLDHTTPVWMPSPIAHVTGILFGLYDSLLAGAKLVLQDAWDPEFALDLISRERAVFTVSATPFIAAMVEVGMRPDLDISSFKYFLSGGARVPPSLVVRAREEMGISLLRVFGSSEAPLHTLNLPTDPLEKITGRDGRSLDPQVRIKVVDPDDPGRTLAAGELGEYATSGPHVFLGYYGDPERTRECKDDEGWYRSGDLCTIDEDGYVLYVDRIKDIINRGGTKISALEVENLLAEHPSVQSAAVVALPDNRLGELACAFVIPKRGAFVDLKSVTKFLDQMGVTKQKWPERLEIVTEFPVTATGKIQKAVLRDRLAASGAAG